MTECSPYKKGGTEGIISRILQSELNTQQSLYYYEVWAGRLQSDVQKGEKEIFNKEVALALFLDVEFAL